MRFERIMVWITGAAAVFGLVSTVAKLSTGADWLDSADTASVAFTAWIGWLAALRWRETAEETGAALARVRLNWSAP